MGGSANMDGAINFEVDGAINFEVDCAEIAQPTKITAHEYAQARGWSRSEIEATVTRGVADEDVEALATTSLAPEALLEWCRAQVEARR